MKRKFDITFAKLEAILTKYHCKLIFAISPEIKTDAFTMGKKFIAKLKRIGTDELLALGLGDTFDGAIEHCLTQLENSSVVVKINEDEDL